jgi:hypothetical protein
VQKFLFIPKSEVRSLDFTGATGRTFDLQVQTKAHILKTCLLYSDYNSNKKIPGAITCENSS